MAEKIEALVEGGSASAGPPLGPALGPLGVNVMDIIGAINEKTKDFEGMSVPVVVEVDPDTKDFTITVGTPPTSQLLMSELGIESGSGQPNAVKVGDLTLEQAMKVARMKQDDLLGADLKARTKEVLGTANSLGLTCEGQDPREVQKLIGEGRYDSRFD